MDTHCSSCKAVIADQNPKCSECGAIQDSFVYKSRIAAASLAIFAGIFGAHRFFLGQWRGIFYLLFFWTYIPWLVGLIEGIVFLSTSQKAWNEKYNQGVSAGSEKGTVIIVLACVFPAIAVLGIIAAVALPAYQDYTVRAKVAGVVASSSLVTQRVEAYVHENQTWPEKLSDIDLGPSLNAEFIDAIEVEDGVIYITPSLGSAVSGSVIYVPLVSKEGITWDCKASTLEPRYLPEKCR